jgi:glutathione S-transferase
MDAAKLNDWMQVVGIFAVVASLIFVGLQMKQTQEIAVASQFQARSTEFQALSRTGVEANWTYPPLRPFISEQFSAADISAAVWSWAGFDNHHFQYQSGFLSEEAWNAQLSAQQQIYSNCYLRFVYEFSKGRMRKSVVDLVESWENSCVATD